MTTSSQHALKAGTRVRSGDIRPCDRGVTCGVKADVCINIQRYILLQRQKKHSQIKSLSSLSLCPSGLCLGMIPRELPQSLLGEEFEAKTQICCSSAHAASSGVKSAALMSVSELRQTHGSVTLCSSLGSFQQSVSVLKESCT